MIIILFIPLGLLSLTIAFLALQRDLRRHALICALFGIFFLSVAAILSYGTSVLIEKMPPLT